MMVTCDFDQVCASSSRVYVVALLKKSTLPRIYGRDRHVQSDTELDQGPPAAGKYTSDLIQLVCMALWTEAVLYMAGDNVGVKNQSFPLSKTMAWMHVIVSQAVLFRTRAKAIESSRYKSWVCRIWEGFRVTCVSSLAGSSKASVLSL